MDYDAMVGKQIRQMGEMLAHHTEHREIYTAVCDGLAAAGIVPVNSYITLDDLSISVSGDKKVLEESYWLLRSLGFERPTDMPKKGDAAWSSFFYHPDGAKVWFSYASTVCKRVQVGEETITRPVYEIQCGEGVELAD